LDQIPRVLLAHAFEIGEARRLLRVERLRRVGLELDGVGARLGGHVDQLLPHPEVAVVVGARLRDDEARFARADPSLADTDPLHAHLPVTAGSRIAAATRAAPPPSTSSRPRTPSDARSAASPARRRKAASRWPVSASSPAAPPATAALASTNA